MTDNELDQVLNRWKAPLPSPALRATVLKNFPRQEPRRLRRPLMWTAAAAVLCVLVVIGVGEAQSGHGTLENFSTGVRRVSEGVNQWFDNMWVAHILMAFRNSHPKIYVDGELQSDAEFGGGGAGCWLRIPGEGKYYIALSRSVIEGPAPPVAGRFDGHILEFQAGARTVRIESRHTYGFGMLRPVFVMGPVAGR